MKKLFSLFFSLVLILFFSINSNSQVALYTFSQSTGAYVEIAGDTTVAFATGTGTSTVESMDDVTYPNNLLPFPFQYNGTVYTSIDINSNGFISFGTPSPPGVSYTIISTVAGSSGGASAGFNRDLIGTRGVTAVRTLSSFDLTGVPAAQFVGLEVGRIITGTGIPPLTTITVLNSGAGIITMSAMATSTGAAATYLVASGSIVRGTSGGVHTIQFRNVRAFTTAANENNQNFQIRLHQAGNLVEVVYGPTSSSLSTTGQVGLRGVLNTDFNNRTTATNWSATTAGGVNTATCTIAPTVLPPTGLSFLWSKPVSIPDDVGITAITIPLDPLDTKSFIPCATVRNFGTNNQLTPFPVTATIQPGGYSSTVTDTVSAGLSNQVCFAKFIPASDTQTYTITVYTSLGSDGNRSNDTLRITRKFPKSNSSYDPICQYYAANSMATLGFPLPQPQSRPEYCWKDTTGSINLILNTTNRGTLFGSLDDGHYRLRIKDILLAMNQDTTGKRIKYCGTCYDSIFPGTNGVIGLSLADGNTGFINSFTIDTVNAAYNALFPLWKDNNYGVLGTGAGSNRLSVKAKDHQLIITYDRVAAFSNNAMWTSHQTVIEIVKDCADPNSNFRYTYTDTTTGQSSGAFVTNYVNSYNAVLPAATTFFNNFVGITGPSPNSMSIFRGYSSPGNPFTGPNQVDIKRNIYDLATRRALALEYGPDPNVLNLHDCLTLTASVALEGLQRNPQPRVRDTIDIELRDCQSPPYKLMQKARVYLSDSVVAGARRYGRVSIELSLLKRNFPYYLRIRHRNSIASWSQSVITLTGDTLSYDFTSALTQIFGNNGVLVNGNASFYSGDVNQDGVVDGSDLSAVDNDAFNFVQGDYVITDLNWDGIVDGSDAAIADNNAANFVTEVAPPGFVVDDSYAELPTYDYKQTEIIAIPDLNAPPKIDLQFAPKVEN